MSFPAYNDPANESPARIHRLVQCAHEGYDADRLAQVFYAETKAIFATSNSNSMMPRMSELLEAMEEAREVIGD